MAFATYPLREFLLGPQHNAWLRCGTFSVYARKGYHVWDGPQGMEDHHTLDIANIENVPSARGKGQFWYAIVEAQKMMADPVVRGNITHLYIENVLNYQLRKSLLKRGWEPCIQAGTPVGCFNLELETVSA